MGRFGGGGWGGGGCGGRGVDQGDVEGLGGPGAGGLERVCSVGRRLAGMSDQDVEELAKN